LAAQRQNKKAAQALQKIYAPALRSSVSYYQKLLKNTFQGYNQKLY
jgi:hypothetical protein